MKKNEANLDFNQAKGTILKPLFKLSVGSKKLRFSPDEKLQRSLSAETILRRQNDLGKILQLRKTEDQKPSGTELERVPSDQIVSFGTKLRLRSSQEMELTKSPSMQKNLSQNNPNSNTIGSVTQLRSGNFRRSGSDGSVTFGRILKTKKTVEKSGSISRLPSISTSLGSYLSTESFKLTEEELQDAIMSLGMDSISATELLNALKDVISQAFFFNFFAEHF